jgi:uncharacterized protein
MKRLVRFLAPLLALVGAGTAPACQRNPQPAGAAPASAPRSTRADDHGLRGPFLWEVQGAGGTSTLFGTIHAGYQADRELPAWIWERLDRADTFVMELDPTSISPMQVMEIGRLPPGESLDQLLGEKDWRSLVELTRAPESSLRVLKPWVATLLVLQALYPTPVSLDEALRRRAVAGGKELVFLEDWELQAEILAMSGVDDLRGLLDPAGTSRAQLEEMVRVYREGNFERLAELALDPAEIAKHPERHRRLFDDRNRAWVGALVPHLDRGGTFVAVGAGHFAGEEGLIELLRARGYLLSRVVEP